MQSLQFRFECKDNTIFTNDKQNDQVFEKKKRKRFLNVIRTTEILTILK